MDWSSSPSVDGIQIMIDPRLKGKGVKLQGRCWSLSVPIPSVDIDLQHSATTPDRLDAVFAPAFHARQKLGEHDRI
jgi:hypothetical protein